MSLHQFPDIIQGSDEWHALRRGLVTASVVGQLVTPTLKVAANAEARAITAALVAERITGFTDDGYVSADMERGWDDEPRAREAYEQRRRVRVESCGLMVRTVENGARIGYSPDGLVGEDGLIEVKSRQPKHHLRTILTDAVPGPNIAQIQAGLFVSGRQWCDYVSYCGGMPMWVIRVTPDDSWHDAITDALRAFEDAAAAMSRAYHTAVNGLPLTKRTDHLAGIEF